MKKKLGLLFLFVIFVIQIQGQTLTNNDIVGIWTVKKVNSLAQFPDEQKQTMEILKNALLKSKFDFSAEGNFSFDFEFEDMQIKNGHWKYRVLTNSFIIQDWKDKDTDESLLMEIFAKKENNKIQFFLSETFFTLEMQKEN